MLDVTSTEPGNVTWKATVTDNSPDR